MKELLSNFILKVVSALSGFGTNAITSKLLGPEGRGEYAIFVSCVLLVGAFSRSFWASFTHMYPRHAEHFLMPMLILSFVSSLVCIPIALFFPTLKVFLILLSISTFAYTLLAYVEAVAYALDRSILANLTQSLPQILAFIFIFLGLIFVDSSSYISVLAWTLAMCISLMAFSGFLLRNIGNTFKLDLVVFRHLLSHGIFVALSSFSSMFLYRVDLFYIERALGKYELGIYSVSFTIAELSTILASFILVSYTGKFVGKEARSYLKLSMLVLSFLQAVLILTYAMLGKPFIRTFFGEAFLDAYLPGLILLLGLSLFRVASLIAVYLNVKLGKTRIPFYVSSSMLFLKIGIFFILVPGSLMHVAWISFFVYAFGMLVYAYIFWKL